MRASDGRGGRNTTRVVAVEPKSGTGFETAAARPRPDAACEPLLQGGGAAEDAVGPIAVDVVVLVRHQHAAGGGKEPGGVVHDAGPAHRHAGAGPDGGKAIAAAGHGGVVDEQEHVLPGAAGGDADVRIVGDHAVAHHAANGSPERAVGDDAEQVVLDPGAVDGDVGLDAGGGLDDDSTGGAAASIVGDGAVGDEELGGTGGIERDAGVGAAQVVDLHLMKVQHSGAGKVDQAEDPGV